MKPQDARALFPGLSQKAYLNFAGQAPLNIRAARAIARITKRYMTEGFLDMESWKKNQAEARARFAWLLGADDTEIALVSNTSRGLLIAMAAIPWAQGDNVIVQKHAFPAIIYPWFHSPVPGVEVRWAEARPREFLDEVRTLADGRTRAVFLDWVHFATGEMVDLAGLSQLAEERDLFLVVDGSQGLGALFPDMDGLRVDFWANTAGKWLLGVEGTAFLYIRQEAMERLVPGGLGWLSGEYETFSSLFPMPEPARGASRFEEGSRNLLGIAGNAASLTIFQEVGKEQIQARVRELTEELFGLAEEKGFEIATPREPRAGIVALRPPGDPGAYHESLTRQGVVVSLREGLLRVAPHFVTTRDDIERVFSG